MGVRVITDTSESMSALYDSVTELAFGPLFHNDEGSAEDFLNWYNARSFAKHLDLRSMNQDQLFQAIAEWRIVHAAAQEPLPFPEAPF